MMRTNVRGDISRSRNSGSRDIGYGFVNLERPGEEQVKNGLRNGRSGISAWAGHRRSGDSGLWVRIKEQWADRRVMTANTRVRGPRRVSRSSSIRRPLSSNKGISQNRSHPQGP